mgnify:CR=1 FL=1
MLDFVFVISEATSVFLPSHHTNSQRVFDGKGVLFKIECVPIHTDGLASTKSVESSHHDGQFQFRPSYYFKKFLDFFITIEGTAENILLGSVHEICRI